MSNFDESASEISRFSTDRSNRGRWPAVELGTLNLITSQHVVDAAHRIETGEMISLARPMRPGIDPVMLAVGTKPRRSGRGGSVHDHLSARIHGPALTHIDALCHVWDRGELWDGRSPDEAISFEGSSFAGVEHWRGGIVTRGVILDVPHWRQEPYVTMDSPVTGAELVEIADAQGVALSPGDALVVYSGRDRWEQSVCMWGVEPPPGFDATEPVARPGLAPSCLLPLREWDCSLLVWDMMDHQPLPEGLDWSIHGSIPAFGLPLVDNAHLGDLSARCRQLGRWDFLLVIAPLPVEGASGSLANPLAIL